MACEKPYRVGMARRRAGRGAPSARSAVLTFLLASLAALGALVGGGVLVLRAVGEDEAVDQARRTALLTGQGIVEPALTDAVLTGRGPAVARVDRLVTERVLDDRVVRVKLWTPDGRIVYSDEPRLIGARYALGADERKALRTGAAAAAESDLERPENRYERPEGRLLEVYLPVRTPSGRQLLYESYQRFGSIASGGQRLWLAFAPVALGALVIFWLVQVPLAWTMARRLESGRREREDLLENALEASAAERRRIASDLHDGVVQDLAGLSYALSAGAERAADDPPARDVLRRGAAGVRASIRRLRSMIVEIHPPDLHAEGLGAALQDLAAPLREAGVGVEVVVPDDLALEPRVEELLYRGAREALRNVAEHAEAGRVRLEVAAGPERVRLVVEDDGRGIDDARRAERRAEGHVGLVLLAELAAHLDGELTVGPRPGGGTRLELEAPT